MSTAATYIVDAIRADIRHEQTPPVVPLNDGTYVRLHNGQIGIIRNWLPEWDAFVVEKIDGEFGSYAWDIEPLAAIRCALLS